MEKYFTQLSYNVLRKSFTEPAFQAVLILTKNLVTMPVEDVKTHFTTQKTNMTLVLDGLLSTEKLK